VDYEYDIAVLMEDYRQPAILVRRPYPPLNLASTNSHIGGRPCLPAGLEWPRMRNGTPLHFLAQIDCGALPENGSVLPTTGILFFFARIDEEMLWGENGEPADEYCRVLYASKAGADPTEVPRDLPELIFGIAGPAVDFKLPGEPAMQIYPEWPVEFYAIETWPDVTALPRWSSDAWDMKDPAKREQAREFGERYTAALRKRREAETLRVLGERLNSAELADWQRTFFAPGSSFSLPASTDDHTFPQAWVLIARIARHIAKQSANRMWPAPDQRGPDPAVLAEIQSGAMAWVAAADLHELDSAPDAASSQAFAHWITDIAGNQFFRHKVASALRKGIESAIQFAATAPKAANLIPALYYAQIGDRRCEHQMLGNAPSAQEARNVERDEVLLLQLGSDYGVNFMFCDVGQVQFWIDRRDLAARRFDRIFATTAGH